MPMLSKPAFGPRTSIIYITAGALIDVWTVVWYFAFARDKTGDLTSNATFWLWGFFLTGLTLVTIGILIGRIGHAARKAELPPSEVVRDEAVIQATAAANQHPVVMTPGGYTASMTPAAVPNGVVMPTAPAAPAAPTPFIPGVTKR